MTKFISAKKPTDQANALREVNRKLRKLRHEARTLKAEKQALQTLLFKTSRGESFQFNGDDGYLQQLEWVHHEREDVNDDAVRRFYARQGKRVPLKRSEWYTTRISYVAE
jgi:hypothetical protein